MSNPLKRVEIKIKEIESLEFEIKNALNATEKIINELNKRELEDKIVLLRIKGELKDTKTSDIKFSRIEDFVKQKGAFFLLKNTHELKTKELEFEAEIENSDNVEEETIRIHSEKKPSKFNVFIPQLINSLSIEKQEGEKSETFSNRLLEETKKILSF